MSQQIRNPSPKFPYKITPKKLNSTRKLCLRMARPIPDIDLRDISKLNEGDTQVPEDKSYFDLAVAKITRNKSSRNLIFGTFSGWLAGITLTRVGKVAAFGLGGGIILLHYACELGYLNVNWERVRESAKQSQASLDKLVRFVKKNSCYSVGFVGGFFFGRSSIPASTLPPAIPEPIERPPVPPDPVISTPLPLTPTPKPAEPFKPTEEPNMFLEKPSYLAQPKPIPHSPKISPSSIPNPSPSVSTTKQMEPGYPNYGSYLYSIPGYSAFQPVSYPGMVQPNQAPIVPNEVANKEFIPFPSMAQKENPVEETSKPEIKNVTESQPTQPSKAMPKLQTDFEEQFTPEIIPAVSMPEVSQNSECKMSITSLTQGSGATVTIPSHLPNKDSKMKTTERFSLKTSIPISKIDLKCVNNPPDTVFQNSLTKKVPVAQTFQMPKPEQNSPQNSRVEIQSNIIIKTAQEIENKEIKPNPPSNNSISTLINAAEAINKTESQFRKPEQISDVLHEGMNPAPPIFPTQIPNSIQRPIFNPINMETNKVNYSNKPPDGSFNEQKNQILLIQNKNTTNPKMLLTIQQQNPQVLLQRTNFESKNLQAPSRLLNQSKKCKDEIVSDKGTSSKVVALKRLHQENCDENDFENLITENQIYGNKIVVKEKSQGTQQEQDLKNKVNKGEKPAQGETKNVVLQPNFLYLSNVQIPGNFMMIKNNTKLTQTNDSNKTSNENKTTEVITPTNNTDSISSIKLTKTQNVAVSKDIHVLKSSNNVLQTLSNNNSKTDLVFQTTNQKVIMNPQIVYQVPMIVDTDNKINQQFNNKEYPKYVTQNKKEFSKPFEQPTQNDKLFIACPYQMDSKLQPKIVITNIRPKISKLEEVSSLDIYEKRRRLRRLKYLTNRDTKEQKLEINKKAQEKTDVRKNIITPKNMTIEICKEFASAKFNVAESGSDSDSDYGEEELKVYNKIINEHGDKSDEENGKIKFLFGLNLATHKIYKEKEMEKQERTLKFDSVASAYIAAGRLDKIMNEDRHIETLSLSSNCLTSNKTVYEDKEQDNVPSLQRKLNFLSQLKLVNVTEQYKKGYEKAWQEILKERERRSGVNRSGPKIKQPRADADLDPNDQLQILTEIKKCVNENNNLIKMRLDSSLRENEGDSIKVLAEKNFSELNRLSKMADRSVKLFSGQETRKRDLNPGFDSENIKKVYKLEQKIYPSINIPNISKIISLKTTQESNVVVSTQATSMDEPQSCAAGVKEMFTEPEVGKTQDFSCQVEDASSWLGVEAIVKSYREYDAARRKEIADLHRRNTSLRVECAHVTRAASRDSDRARALLAERQNLATEETGIRASIQKLCAAVRAIRSS